MTDLVQRGSLVVGLGSPDGGDDAVGLAVAGAVATQHPDVAVVVHEDPTALLDLWAGHPFVLVIDAVCSGGAAGSLHWLETGRAGLPVSREAWAHSGRASTHAIGLAEMVELARALGRLPQRLVVVGVEAERFDHGAPLSTAVAAAVPAAVERVGAALLHAGRKERSDVPR